MKVMALDIGSKRTGVAVSDDRGTLAFPRTTILAKNKKEWLSQVNALIDEEEVEQVIVGLPLNQYGEEGDDAENVRKFTALLRGNKKVDVVEWDERYTTVQAERVLIDADLSRKKRKGVIDKVAASIILQSYLDSLHFQPLDFD